MGTSSYVLFVTIFIGKVLCKMVDFCLTLSTCIHTLAMFLVSSISKADNCCLPLVNAGICRFAYFKPTYSAISKPLSAKVISPGSNLLKRPQLAVIYLSLTPPPQQLDTNYTTPCGVIYTSKHLHNIL